LTYLEADQIARNIAHIPTAPYSAAARFEVSSTNTDWQFTSRVLKGIQRARTELAAVSY